MGHVLRTAFFGAGVLWLAASAHAQYGRYPGDYPNDPYSRNDPYYSGRTGPSYRGDLIDRVLSDVDRSQGYSQGYRNEGRSNRKEFDRARRDLFRFRESLSRGRFDRGRLDEAIESVHKLVDSRWLSPRDHDILSRDLYALRQYRSDGGYGAPWRGRY